MCVQPEAHWIEEGKDDPQYNGQEEIAPKGKHQCWHLIIYRQVADKNRRARPKYSCSDANQVAAIETGYLAGLFNGRVQCMPPSVQTEQSAVSYHLAPTDGIDSYN